MEDQDASADGETNKPAAVPFVSIDPAHPLTLASKKVEIPDPSHRLTELFKQRELEYVDEENDEADTQVFETAPEPEPNEQQPSAPDWEHDEQWVSATVSNLLPPPTEASPMATNALQKELRDMMREQDNARSLRELGWYMPPAFMGDNLFQWIVEMHSFDNSLPIAQDMTDQYVRYQLPSQRVTDDLSFVLTCSGVNSLVFEIRFPSSFPHSPPFFRILKPRFLPFIQVRTRVFVLFNVLITLFIEIGRRRTRHRRSVYFSLDLRANRAHHVLCRWIDVHGSTDRGR